MIVQHNLTAMNSNRMLGITTKSQAKSTEKLSSGYKINRAADDAAGLSISEKMRKQIRGLTQASLNAQDGISAVQTAEGALTEVHDMLQRMNELAVKAANGTNSVEDRKYIQSEVDQLVSEIDRVAETTKFNETYLLKGDADSASTVETTVNATVKSIKIATGKEYSAKYSITGNDTIWIIKNDGTATKAAGYSSADTDDISEYVNADGSLKAGYTAYTSYTATGHTYGTAVKDTKTDSLTLQTTWKGLAKLDGSDYVAVEQSELKAGGKYFDAQGNYLGGLYSVSDDGSDGVEIGAEQIKNYVDRDATPGSTRKDTTTGALSFSLHVGAESANDNKITLSIKPMSAIGIGVKGVKVDSETDATAAIDTIKAAIQRVSEQRSTLGAIQNRLEHTINNLDNVVENTTSAEAQIRDTDMATEMVKYSNNNILAQAGQAMLAQSNQANQGVLSLLG